MKRGFLGLVLFFAVWAPLHGRAQVAIYDEATASSFKNQVSSDYLIGTTTGILIDTVHIGHRILMVANIQGRFVESSANKFNGLTLGPRFQTSLGHGLTPYGEFLIGFARYNNPNNFGATTDSTIQINGGIAKRLNPHWDAVADFSYSQYYALGGEFNPKSYSLGAIYHFSKR